MQLSGSEVEFRILPELEGSPVLGQWPNFKDKV